MDFRGTVILATTDQISIKKLNALKKAGIKVIITSRDKDKVNLIELMYKLGETGIDSILLEGDSRLNCCALKKGIVDEIISFVAPKIIGGVTSKSPVGGKGISLLKDAIELELVSVTQVGNDVMIRSKVKNSQQ